MADIKISQLGAAIAVGDTDLVPIVSGGNTLKATAAQVKEHSIGNTNISSIGDGSVTGAINALNTDKQPKTLDTPLTIGGVSKTTVEAALDGLVSENQTLANDKLDKTAVASVIETIGNTPLKSGGYVSGETFLASDGNEYKAKTTISSSTTLNSGSGGNCEQITINSQLDMLNKSLSDVTEVSSTSVTGTDGTVTGTVYFRKYSNGMKLMYAAIADISELDVNDFCTIPQGYLPLRTLYLGGSDAQDHFRNFQLQAQGTVKLYDAPSKGFYVSAFYL